MITVEHLTKCYGDFVAVDDLSFTIEGGHVYGFLGPNGAGKSTTMNIMTGCLSATKGQVKIEGYDIFEQPDKAKKMIGYLPEQPPLYMNETPLEYLRFVGEAKGLRGGRTEPADQPGSGTDPDRERAQPVSISPSRAKRPSLWIPTRWRIICIPSAIWI